MATTAGAPEFGRGKTIGILALVVGCFAVLWPKLFYPMLVGRTANDGRPPMDPAFRQEEVGRDYVLEVCRAVAGGRKLVEELEKRALAYTEACQRTLEMNCGVFLGPELAREFHESRKKPRISVGSALWNLTTCLNVKYGITPKSLFPIVGLEESIKREEFRQWRKGERPPYLHAGMMHPGMRERGQVPHGIHHPGEVPPRPADLAGKPSLGGPGQFIPPQRPGGSMGVVMPVYTLAIVVFFVYTVMKIMFKKDEEPPKERRLEILDPEHRRLIQEYESSNSGSIETWKDRAEREETPMKIEDVEIENLRQRLADTEAAMQRMMATISTVSDRLSSTAKAADIVLPPPPPPVARQKSPSVAKEEEELKDETAEATQNEPEPEEQAEESEQTPKPEPVEAQTEPDPPQEVKEKTSKPSPTLSKRHIHFSENTQIGVRDMQTAAEFPRRSRSRSKERLLDGDDMERGDEDVSNIVLDAALRRDTQLIVSEAECKALPLEEQPPMATDPAADTDDMTPVVLSGKMTISFLGGPDGLSVDVPEGHHRASHDFDGDHHIGNRRKIGGHQAYMREESDPGPGARDKGRRARKWAGQKKIRKRRSSTPTSTRSLDEDDEVGEEEDGLKPVSGEDPNADSSIMDNVPELPDDDGDVEDPDAEDATSAGDENLTGRSKLREECVE